MSNEMENKGMEGNANSTETNGAQKPVKEPLRKRIKNKIEAFQDKHPTICTIAGKAAEFAGYTLAVTAAAATTAATMVFVMEKLEPGCLTGTPDEEQNKLTFTGLSPDEQMKLLDLWGRTNLLEESTSDDTTSDDTTVIGTF